MPRRRLLALLLACACLGVLSAAASAASTAPRTKRTTYAATSRTADVSAVEAIRTAVPGVQTSALHTALQAASCAARSVRVPRPDIVTLIDYAKPSTEPRLWVIDLARRRVLFEELVAHGRESGGNLARHFSNEDGSLQSSLGVFLTGDTYTGSNGYSLRLDGLEPGFNDHARARAIVMHGAAYVRAGMEALGRLGRSWGCPALPLSVARDVIDTIKGGTLVVAYYPDAEWLQESRFLNGCDDTRTLVAN